MTELQKSTLLNAGINVDEALRRLMNNETLLIRVLLRFTNDTSFAALQKALSEGRVEDAFTAAHTLKGVAGNLSMGPVYMLSSDITEALRAGDLETARETMPQLEEKYQAVMAAIRTLPAR